MYYMYIHIYPIHIYIRIYFLICTSMYIAIWIVCVIKSRQDTPHDVLKRHICTYIKIYIKRVYKESVWECTAYIWLDAYIYIYMYTTYVHLYVHIFTLTLTVRRTSDSMHTYTYTCILYGVHLTTCVYIHVYICSIHVVYM